LFESGLAPLVRCLIVTVVDLLLPVMEGWVDWVHEAELVLLVHLALPVVMPFEVFQGLRLHLLLSSELGLF